MISIYRPSRIVGALALAIVFFLMSSWSPSNIQIVEPQHQSTVEKISNSIKDATDPSKPAPDSLPNPASDKDKEKDKEGWDETVYAFQQDHEFTQPKTNLAEFAYLRPHKYDGKLGGNTFATYYCTRKASIQDPYFAATQQLVYRNLWDPKSRSNHFPFTVFVAPHVGEDLRDILRGAGAIVRELPLVEWNPTVAVMSRWKDLFSKLHMWNQTDFKRIAFMDSDAFPIENIDHIFYHADSQRCRSERLDSDDSERLTEICDYIFAGTPIMWLKEINVGVMVFEPNKAMHARLLRNFVKTDEYDNKMAEQAFLNWQFNSDGPFPASFLGREYNGFYPQPDEEGKLKVVHEKLWAFSGDPSAAAWTGHLFEDTWNDMIKFYDSPEFKEARMKDNI
ncbi:hypothetical protein B7494_g2676 [Chlorociboria aeruginascens]|nr:hypothetical protein B7494_g2676 [Chlorociboria aeruginascens]